MHHEEGSIEKRSIWTMCCTLAIFLLLSPFISTLAHQMLVLQKMEEEEEEEKEEEMKKKKMKTMKTKNNNQRIGFFIIAFDKNSIK